MVAEDDLTDEAIAESVGISRRQLARWKLEPAFIESVNEQAELIQAGMRRLAIAKKHKRLKVLDDLHSKHLEAIGLRAQRIAAEISEDTPQSATRKFFGNHIPAEAVTGLFVRKETVMANGMSTVEWVYDGAIPKMITHLEEQAAKELGQWTEKSDVNLGGMVRTIVLEDD
jgi:hypothetical protein